MESLSLHTGESTVHWEDNTSFISIVGDKRFTLGVKHIYITVCLLQEQFYNGIFIPEYDKSSVILSDKCTKPCSGIIISRTNKWMTGFILYPTSYTEHYQLMILHEFVVN